MNDERSDHETPGEPPVSDGIDAKAAFELGAGSTLPGVPASWSPPEPETLDPLFPNYRIVSLVGRGGMGAVYRGVQESLDREVAIKVLPPEMAEVDPSFAERFQREAKSMARLDHPNIVRVHDFGRTSAGHWFIVMEFVDGMDFHQLIRSGELDVTGALDAVSQICDALEYAHGMGYVHRDIKPENIFINRKGVLKVGDFGLAKLIEGDPAGAPQPSLTLTGASMGTPFYCAPEQMEGRETDHRADIYSLGVMLYEMLTRELPRGNFPPPSRKAGVDARLDEVVMRAMESERDRRYPSAGEMRTDVDAVRTSPPAPPKNPNPDASPMNTTTAPVSTVSVPSEQRSNAKVFGVIGLICFILAILSPLVVMLVASSVKLPTVVLLLASPLLLLLSLIFGIIGWKHVTGKIAVIGSICLGFLSVVIGVISIYFFSLKPTVVSDGPMDRTMEAERVESIEFLPDPE
ncbi:hypothetical protein HAHE_14440 [Haloferula helveola]|uniref:Protein kinase domain-containing protein n=1 Tax=Haloferula helveola TaxID=490095 RepID=A0ABN6H1S7_9BACT|nr:hypothetical protein HAHE_14440 [Haloferula helveola]